jgi:hypothetical protein
MIQVWWKRTSSILVRLKRDVSKALAKGLQSAYPE